MVHHYWCSSNRSSRSNVYGHRGMTAGEQIRKTCKSCFVLVHSLLTSSNPITQPWIARLLEFLFSQFVQCLSLQTTRWSRWEGKYRVPIMSAPTVTKMKGLLRHLQMCNNTSRPQQLKVSLVVYGTMDQFTVLCIWYLWILNALNFFLFNLWNLIFRFVMWCCTLSLCVIVCICVPLYKETWPVVICVCLFSQLWRVLNHLVQPCQQIIINLSHQKWVASMC